MMRKLWLIGLVAGGSVIGSAASSQAVGVSVGNGSVSWQGMRLDYDVLAGIPHEPNRGEILVSLTSATVPLYPTKFELLPGETRPDGSLAVTAIFNLTAGGDQPVYGWLNLAHAADQGTCYFSYWEGYRPQDGQTALTMYLAPITWTGNPVLSYGVIDKPFPSAANWYNWQLQVSGYIAASSVPDFLAIVPEPSSLLGCLALLPLYRPRR